MRFLLIENLAVLLSAGIGFVFGTRYLSVKKTLYATMIVLGVGCILLGRLYQCARLLSGETITDIFQVGILGIAGAFSFFFSSNYGQIDSLVDDGSKEFAKYRLIAILGPMCIAALFVPILLGPSRITFKIGCGFTACLIAVACYFHVKHLFIPDVDYGVVRCLRIYNALAFCLAILTMAELIALANELELLFIVSGIGLCAVSLALVPVMDRGVKAWRT